MQTFLYKKRAVKQLAIIASGEAGCRHRPDSLMNNPFLAEIK